MQKKEYQRGMTLLELMIVMAIAAILVGIAAPGFTNFIKSNSIESLRDSLANAVKLARSEAISEKVQVVICSSSNQASCGGQWQQGWIVFQDDNGDGSLSTGERLVHSEVGITRLGVTGNGAGVGSFSFAASGLRVPPAGGQMSIEVCDPDAEVNGKRLVISATGSIQYVNSASSGC